MIAGSTVVEERRGFGVQYLHSDSSREWGAGSLGPRYLSLPHASASGKNTPASWTQFYTLMLGNLIKSHFFSSQEPHIGAEGMLGAGLSPEQLRLLQRFSPELSWDQTETAAPLPCRADGDTIGFFIAKFLKNWPEGMFSLMAPSALTRDCRREQ